jgi:undecaprenyl diphosphate synthase
MPKMLRIFGIPDRDAGPDNAETAKAVAIIMDGNGRWASRRGVGVAEGHRAGSRALRPVVETAIDLGVESLAVYAFSTENWTRSEEEVGALMETFAETIERELPDLVAQGVRVHFIGRRDRAPEDLQERMAKLERETRRNDRLSLTFAAQLYAPSMPDPDLLIRTSGELRISNFLLWQLAYSELVFVDTLWPDFGPRQLREALGAYARRRRRFGGR